MGGNAGAIGPRVVAVQAETFVIWSFRCIATVILPT